MNDKNVDVLLKLLNQIVDYGSATIELGTPQSAALIALLKASKK
jgi:hypothetical protein